MESSRTAANVVARMMFTIVNDIYMSHRDRQRQRTIADIIDAAERVVLESEGGVESLTVQQIASAIGMTPGALYRYFPSRDAIIAAVQRKVISALGRAITQATAGVLEGEDSEIVRLFAVAFALLAFAREQPLLYGLLSRMLAVPHPLVSDIEAAEVLPEALAALASVQALFTEARQRKALGEGDDRARLAAWWATVHGAIQLDKLARFSKDARAEHIAATALTAMAIGWGASSESVARAIQQTFRGAEC